MKKALVTAAALEPYIGKLEASGYEILFEKDERQITYRAAMEDVEVLIGNNPFQSLCLQDLKKLRWIQLISMGVDRVPVKEVQKKGMMLTNAHGIYSIPIAEWIVLKILEIAKQSRQFWKQQNSAVWQKQRELLEITGKKIGMIGTGSIAKQAANMLAGFSPVLLGLNTSGRMTAPFHHSFSIDEIDAFLRACDIVIVTVPLTNETKGMLDARRLSLLRKGAILINVSRGGILDEKALVSQLEKGHLFGAALDVFEQEPLVPESPLWQTERLSITPHNSYVSPQNGERLFHLVYNNMVRFLKGEELRNLVDLNRGY